MLKSRLLAGSALLLALSCAIPCGIAAKNQSDADLLRAAAQNTSDTVGVYTDCIEYAIALSGDPVNLSGAELNFATASEVVALPNDHKGAVDESTGGIRYDDPLVQRGLEAACAKEEHLKSATQSQTDGDVYADGFKFDINKTIFPVTEEEVEMLKYVVEAEGGGGSLEDKRLVTFSITNRVLSKNFPDTLYKVLHSVNQFSTIQNYYEKKKIPSATTCRAVEEVLMGACTDNSQNALYFYCTQYPVAPSVVDWFENDLVYLYTVGCDRFFTDPIPQ